MKGEGTSLNTSKSRITSSFLVQKVIFPSAFTKIDIFEIYAMRIVNMKVELPNYRSVLELLNHKIILEFLEHRSILTLLELQEHKNILVAFQREVDNIDDIDAKQLIEWIMKTEEKKPIKLKAVFYLVSHFDHFEDQGKNMRRVLYECLREQLQWCLEKEEISQEMYE